VRSGQVSLALQCPLDTAGTLEAGGTWLHTLLRVSCLELSSAWGKDGGPSQRGPRAPPGLDTNWIRLCRTSRRRERDPGDSLGATCSRQPRAAGRRRTAAGCKGANFYTYFLFHFGFGGGSGTDFPPPGEVASLASTPTPEGCASSFEKFSLVTKSDPQEGQLVGLNITNNKRLKEGAAASGSAIKQRAGVEIKKKPLERESEMEHVAQSLAAFFLPSAQAICLSVCDSLAVPPTAQTKFDKSRRRGVGLPEPTLLSAPCAPLLGNNPTNSQPRAQTYV
jgi:hypothetical protein